VGPKGEKVVSEDQHSNSSVKWLYFFFICFIVVMAIGGFAIFTYNANAPEAAPSSAHGGMLLPQDGQYARNSQVYLVG
jgi:cytochrome b subunit of formate dehydrogenase